jgi:hypothetical protein
VATVDREEGDRGERVIAAEHPSPAELRAALKQSRVDLAGATKQIAALLVEKRDLLAELEGYRNLRKDDRLEVEQEAAREEEHVSRPTPKPYPTGVPPGPIGT